jgi:hypothetical protein
MESDDRSLISVLTRDRRRIANLLARLVTRGVDRRQLADEVTSVLIRHMVAEELYLYPVVREVLPEYAVDVAHHLGIDARVEQILADLTAVEPDSNPFDALITKLIAEASRAILHEELDVFPLLAQHGDRQTLTGLGDMVKAFEDATVVEKTSCGGLAIRFGDRVIHRWVPAALVD